MMFSGDSSGPLMPPKFQPGRSKGRYSMVATGLARSIIPTVTVVEPMPEEVMYELRKAGKVYHPEEEKTSGIVIKVNDIFDLEEVRLNL